MTNNDRSTTVYTIRVSARSLCFHQGKVLVEQPTRDSISFYYFPGGELKLGEFLIDCLSREYSEETTSKVIKADYLFVVENHFQYEGDQWHSLEHYFLVELDKYVINTREFNIKHHWLPFDSIEKYDIRPHVVRDAIHQGTWRTERHFIHNSGCKGKYGKGRKISEIPDNTKGIGIR